MTQSTPGVLTLKESRGGAWLILSILIGTSGLAALQGKPGGIFMSLLFIGALLLIGPGNVATFDSLRRLVVIKDRSFLRPPVVTEIPFEAIASVAIDQEVERGHDRRGRTYYHLVVVWLTGKQTVLPATSSTSRSMCEQQAQQINALLDVEGRPVLLVEPSISRQAREGRTGSIAWRLEKLSSTRARGAIRWFSSAASLPGQFIALCQEPAAISRRTGDRRQDWGMPASLTISYLEPLLFDANELPGLKHAGYVADLEPRLSSHFFILSSSAEAARTWLTPRVVDVLVAWAERHSFLYIQAQHGEFDLPMILVSPEGLWVTCQSVIEDPAKTEELIALGVALVEAQQDTV